MFTKPKLLIATAVATLALVVVGAASLAAGIITPATLGEFWADTANTSAAITLPPLELITFTEVGPASVAAPDDRPFAMFNEATAQSAQAVAVSFLGRYDAAQRLLTLDTSEPLPKDNVGFTILATLKYTLPEGVVLVSTAQPTLAAAQHKVLLGDQAITLANGTPAWTKVDEQHSENSKLPSQVWNEVRWVQGDLILTVASPTLPLARVQELAAQVVMK